jgi:hypothetical protein
MQYVRSAKVAARALVAAAALTASVPGLVTAAQYGGNNVQVMVCPQPSESSFDIAVPQSDSVVVEPKLAITGAVEHISQVDFFIDDTYNHTQALGFSALDFSSSVTLAPGTHTLKLVASDSCSQTTHEETVVVTYEPRVAPSLGSAVDTTVDDQAIDVELAEPVADQNVFERYVIPPLTDIAEFLDLTDTPREGEPLSPLPSAGRAVLFVAGASLAVSGIYIGTMATLPAHMAFMVPHRRLFMGGIMTAAAAMLGVVFTF